MPIKRNLRRGLYKEKPEATEKPQKRANPYSREQATKDLARVMEDMFHLHGLQATCVYVLRAIEQEAGERFNAGSVEIENADGDIEYITADTTPEIPGVRRARQPESAYGEDYNALMTTETHRRIFSDVMGDSSFGSRVRALSALRVDDELRSAFQSIVDAADLLESSTESMAATLEETINHFREFLEQRSLQTQLPTPAEAMARFSSLLSEQNELLQEVSFVDSPANTRRVDLASIDFSAVEARLIGVDRGRPTRTFGPPITCRLEAPPVPGPESLWFWQYRRTDDDGVAFYQAVRKTDNNLFRALRAFDVRVSPEEYIRNGLIGCHFNMHEILQFEVEEGHDMQFRHAYWFNAVLNYNRLGRQVRLTHIPLTAITHVDQYGIRAPIAVGQLDDDVIRYR